MPVIASINVSPGGVPKLPVAAAQVTESGVEGDRQRNLKYHGGPDRAVCLYSLELIAALQREGHPIGPGSTGENVTVSGVEWARILPGVCLVLGEVSVEITTFTKPCRTIRGSFLGGRSGRISQKAWPGWSRAYARVLQGGTLRIGDDVRIIPPS